MRYLLICLALLSGAWAGDRPDTMTTHTWMASTWGTATAAGVAPSPVPPPLGSAWKTLWTAWGGAAWDTTNHRLEIVGGGHSDYSGNEIQSFSPTTGWARLTTPTDSSKINHSTSIYTSGYYSMGSGVDSSTPNYNAPRARHTYNNVQSIAGKLYMVYCAGCYPSANDAATSDRYDFGLARWDSLGVPYNPGSPTATANGASAFTGVDSKGRLWWATGGSNSVLAYFSGGKWTTLGSYWDGMALNQYPGCASVPWQNRIYCFGNGQHGYIRMDTTLASDTLKPYITTGATSIESSSGPGITYDSKDSLILGWNGTDTVFVLNLNTAVWTKYAKANTKAPTAAQTNGTFGRWQYMPEYNAVALSNSADDSVYYWKPSAGAGTLTISSGGGSRMLLTGAGR